jgi:hypothetical protein
MTVEPLVHVACAEDTQSAAVVRRLSEGGVVPADGVSLLGEKVVVILALVRAFGQEVLSTAAKQDIWAIELGPGVVFEAMIIRINDMLVLITIPRMCRKPSGSGIGYNTIGQRLIVPSTRNMVAAYPRER